MSAYTFDHLFVRLSIIACVRSFVYLLSFVVCLNISTSAVHSVVIVCAGDIRLLFKLLLKQEPKLPCL